MIGAASRASIGRGTAFNVPRFFTGAAAQRCGSFSARCRRYRSQLVVPAPPSPALPAANRVRHETCTACEKTLLARSLPQRGQTYQPRAERSGAAAERRPRSREFNPIGRGDKCLEGRSLPRPKPTAECLGLGKPPEAWMPNTSTAYFSRKNLVLCDSKELGLPYPIAPTTIGASSTAHPKTKLSQSTSRKDADHRVRRRMSIHNSPAVGGVHSSLPGGPGAGGDGLGTFFWRLPL